MCGGNVEVMDKEAGGHCSDVPFSCNAFHTSVNLTKSIFSFIASMKLSTAAAATRHFLL